MKHDRYKTHTNVLLTNSELVDTFLKNAKEIALPLLAEKRSQRHRLATQIRKELLAIQLESNDKFYRWFWRKSLNATMGENLYVLDGHITRLNRWIRRIQGSPVPEGELTDSMIQTAREVPIESLLDQPLRRSGRTLKGLCPFHNERTPSFVVYTDSNHAHCFGCGVKGNAIDIYMLMNECGFREAVHTLIGAQK